MATSLLHQQECLFNGGSLDVGRINNEEKGHNNNAGGCLEHCAWVMIYFEFQSWSKTSENRWAHFLWKVRCGCFLSSQFWVMFLICCSLWSFAFVVVAHYRWLNKAVAMWRYIPLPKTTFLLFSDDVTFRRFSTTAEVLRRWGVESFWRAVGPDAFARGSRMFSTEPQKRAAVWNGSIFRDSPVWVNVVQVNSQLKHSAAHEHELTQPVIPRGIFTSFDLWLYKTFYPQRVSLKNLKTVDCAWVMKELQERCLPLYFMDEKS